MRTVDTKLFNYNKKCVMSKVAFLHIPKNGGTSLEEHFKRHCRSEIIGYGHEMREKDYEEDTHYRGIIVILRNPLERFFSQYHYWRDGAKSGRFVLPAHVRQSNGDIASDIDSFVKQWMQNVSFIRRIEQKHSWSDHFLPQVHWLNGLNHSKTSIVCFDRHSLSLKVEKVLREYEISRSCDIRDLATKNPTLWYGSAQIRMASRHWLEDKYMADWVLWRKHCVSREL